MLGSYSTCLRSTTNCVHFIYNNETDELDLQILDKLQKAGIEHVYVDYLAVKQSGEKIVGVMTRLLRLPITPGALPHKPGSMLPWVRVLDYLGVLSERQPGIAIIVDNADAFLSDDPRTMFTLVEAFMISFHHWLDKNKPCHLCFQMEKNDLVKRLFAPS
jgi:hypothetical protein